MQRHRSRLFVQRLEGGLEIHLPAIPQEQGAPHPLGILQVGEDQLAVATGLPVLAESEESHDGLASSPNGPTLNFARFGADLLPSKP